LPSCVATPMAASRIETLATGRTGRFSLILATWVLLTGRSALLRPVLRPLSEITKARIFAIPGKQTACCLSEQFTCRWRHYRKLLLEGPHGDLAQRDFRARRDAAACNYNSDAAFLKIIGLYSNTGEGLCYRRHHDAVSGTAQLNVYAEPTNRQRQEQPRSEGLAPTFALVWQPSSDRSLSANRS